jgi:altronate dehydratase small subunit
MGEQAAAPDFLALHERDNVATALRSAPAGSTATVRWVDGQTAEVPLLETIDLGHKVAIAAIGTGDLVIKHGYPMGRATAAIARGEHVHVHNVLSLSRIAGDRATGGA